MNNYYRNYGKFYQRPYHLHWHQNGYREVCYKNHEKPLWWNLTVFVAVVEAILIFAMLLTMLLTKT